MKTNILIIALSLMLTSCNGAPDFKNSGTKPVSHEQWDKLLKKHVSADGKVNYKGFIKDSTDLNKYLKLLSDNLPDENSWTKNEQLAYWINAYNAFTVQLVIRHYPLKSIKDIVKINIPLVNSPWDIKFIKIGNAKMDLNTIEHDIIRKKFKEPRIHFSLVCASKSCPKLRNEAFTAGKLEEQLTAQAKDFLKDSSRNKISKDKIELSKIFDWYSSDFPKGDKLIEFLNQYSPVQINKDVKISYMDYDWDLNE